MKEAIVETLRQYKYDLKGLQDLDTLVEEFKDRKVVMLGEASHGTHEYYNWRARISRRLIEEHGFDFVAVEGDWPPCYQVNRYLKNYKSAEKSTLQVLRSFDRWPSWMWANWEVHGWIDWLKDFNKNLPVDHSKGFYGLDVYSLWESMDAILEYLERQYPEALAAAHKAVACFEPHRDEDGQRYAYSTRLVPEGCQNEVNAMLREILDKSTGYDEDSENAFSTEQNAYVASNAEEYYRVMMRGDGSTWNLRDRHMMDTLNRLLQFHGNNSKAIVWAHNTHIGDASFTDMKDEGLYNIGELARKEYGEENIGLVGFGSYKGSVIAGEAWGATQKEMQLPEARPCTWEEICHQAGTEFFVFSEDLSDQADLQQELDHRAVGVVYHPYRERFGNYVPSIIPRRYDAFVFLNETTALNPIDLEKGKVGMPDTYPFGV